MAIPEDPSAHLADLQSQAWEAIDIEDYIRTHQPIYPSSDEHLDLMERIECIRDDSIREEVERCLSSCLYVQQ